MTGKLIIIEAGDGCGKATQTAALYQRLQKEGFRVHQVEFPDYASDSSALVRLYLQGAFGMHAEDVNAYAASTFFAADRYASFRMKWKEWYEQGDIILADRYTTSNMVHQAVKIEDAAERDTYLDWLWDFEFVKLGLPVPDAVVFLDVPPAISTQLLRQRAAEGGSVPDIHEKDSQYLEKCYAAYGLLAERYGWKKIPCTQDQQLCSVEEIHERIYQSLQAELDSCGKE